MFCFFREASKGQQGDHLGSAQEKAALYYDLLDKHAGGKQGPPSAEYEELRRRIANNVQEMWWALRKLLFIYIDESYASLDPD